MEFLLYKTMFFQIINCEITKTSLSAGAIVLLVPIEFFEQMCKRDALVNILFFIQIKNAFL